MSSPFGRIFHYLNELKTRKIVKNYAIGGGIAAYRYVSMPTKDLDVFVIVKEEGQDLLLLTPIYDYFRGKGYEWQGQWIVIEGISTKFIPADELEKEAIRKAISVPYEDVRTRVVRPEYLAALFLRAGRPREKYRVKLMLEEVKLNKTLLDSILTRYNLMGKLKELA